MATEHPSILVPQVSQQRPAVTFVAFARWRQPYMILAYVVLHVHTALYACREAGCVVVSASYRLAPEHPFPASIDDGCTVTRWVLDHKTLLGKHAIIHCVSKKLHP